MGKKRIIKKSADIEEAGVSTKKVQVSSKKKLDRGVIHIYSSYNNTIITLTDHSGNVFLSSSSGRSGFHGSKKGTPYAASRAAEILADRARDMGLTEVDLRVNGVGAGRESAIRMFGQKGFSISSIKDTTPIPHGHPRPPKPRRV